MSEKQNAKNLPIVVYARHMEAGVCGYEKEMVLIDTEDMKKFSPSFVGKPVYVLHQKVDVANIHNADGYVAECFYNELDGWLWNKIVVVSDLGQQKIREGWSVSNAYVPLAWEGSGKYHNVDYQRKIVNAEFTHLAIVPNPRYENAKIFTLEQFKAYQEEKRSKLNELQNAKRKKTMFNIFKRTKTEVKAGDDLADAMVEIKNDDGTTEEIPLATLIESERARKASELANAKAKKNAEDDDAAKDKKEMANDDSEVDVDGEKMTVKELANRYRNSKKNAKKNAADDADAAAKAKEKADKENAESDKDDEKKKENKNSNDEADAQRKADEKKQFEELQNANKKTQPVHTVDTSYNQVERGKSRYGSGK